MKNKAAIIVFTVLFALFLVNTVFAHSGMTDAAGGHWDNEYNEYHYHCGGNPAHKHYGGICPYNRIPVDTSNKDGYGNGNSNSGTKEERTMDIWDIILIGIIGFVVLAIIFSIVKENIQDKREAKKREQERKSAEADNRIIDLNKKIADLENKNKNLQRKNDEQSEFVSCLKKLNQEQADEINSLKIENDKLKSALKEEKNIVADANYEVTQSREREKIDIEILTQNLSHAFNDYEILNKYYRSVNSGKLESAFNTDLSVSKILKFDIEAEIVSKGKKETNKYNTTFESCTCEDYKYRCHKDNTVCKHMLYLMYSFGVLQLQPERLKASFLVGKSKK